MQGIKDQWKGGTVAADEQSPAGGESDYVKAWTISVRSLRSGMRLTENVYHESGELLLPAGRRITNEFLFRLFRRGIHLVKVGCSTSKDTAGALCGKHEQQLDDLLGRMASIDGSRDVGFHPSGTPLPAARLLEEARRRMDQYASASKVVETVFRDCCNDTKCTSAGVERTVREFLNLVSVDGDLLPMIVSMQEPQNEYLFDHCVNVSILCMRVGACLGLSPEKLHELGMGALLQDVGMLRVPEEMRMAPRRFTDNERIEMRRHALYTLDLLQRLEGLPAIVPFVGYQVHERMDGSGYPRGRSGMFINQYAKIASVIDTYAAMTRPRPHRPAVLPYAAMKEILIEGSRGKLDRTVIRAFLDCVSLFPIGSIVELSNGMRAKVVRANPGQHTRPVVAEVDDSDEPTGIIVDLLKDSSTLVVRALPPSKSKTP